MANSTERNRRNDIILTQSGSTVRGNLTDNQGRLYGRAFRRTQHPRNSLKIQQGGTKYSDWEPPYRSIEQRNFAGGFGIRDLEADATRFYDSYRCNTWMEGKVIAGPEEQYATGMRSAQDEYWWDESTERTKLFLYASDDDFAALIQTFTASDTYTPEYVQIVVGVDRWRGAIGNTRVLQVKIFTDNGGRPDALVCATDTFYLDQHGHLIVTKPFTTSGELTGSSTYHIALIVDRSGILNPLTATDSAYTWIDSNYSGTISLEDDLGSGSDPGGGFFFRIYPEEPSFTPYFFEHQGALYCIRSFEDHETYNPDVFINGDRGKCTGVTSSTATDTLQDTTKSWTNDEWIGCIVRLVSGIGSDASLPYREIVDNDGDTLTVSPDWEVQPDENTRYAIVGSNKWTEKTGHGLFGRITDVHVSGNIVYACLGDRNNIFHMFDDTWEEEEGNQGSFMTEAIDSETGNRTLFLARAGWPPMIYSAAPVWTETNLSIPDLDFASSMITKVTSPDFVDGNMESASEEWVAIGDVIMNVVTHNPDADPSTDRTYVYQGVYSREIDNCNASEGMYQSITLDNGSTYRVRARAMTQPFEGFTGGVVMKIDNTTLDQISGISAKTKWWLLDAYFTASSGSMDLKFMGKSASNHFFVDNVLLEKISDNLEYFGDERITNILPYGPQQHLHVITTGGIYREVRGDYYKITPIELSFSDDDRNGRAATQFGEYLYLSFLDGTARYYDRIFDQIGPNLDEGMPEDRRGDVSDFAVYPGRMYAAIDGGESNYSSILVYNGLGWHEAYRAPATGLRIKKLYLQTMPGTNIDRLWFGEGSDVGWICVDTNPLANSNYRYTTVATLDQATIYASMPDIDKQFKQVKITWSGTGQIFVAYGDYESENIVHIHETRVGYVDTKPAEALSIDETLKYIYFRFMLEITSSSTTPRIVAVTVDLLEHIPVKYAYQWSMLLRDYRENLQGVRDSDRVETATDALDAMNDSAGLVTMETPFSYADDIDVKITTVDYVPLIIDGEIQRESVIATIQAIDD